MARISKNRKAVIAKFNLEKEYSLTDAAKMLKDITFTKFDASVDVDIRLGIDPKKSDQMVRGVVSLPHGLGKVVRVLVLCTPDKVQEAKDAGAEHAGLDEFITKIEGGWTDIDVIITMPTVMAKVGKLGKVLGPRGLMPNPKSGTVTLEVGKAVKEVKAGKVDFKIDKQGIIHASIGKASFSADMIKENAAELINMVVKLKPASSKGTYIQSVALSTTMSPGIRIDSSSLNA
ncbi:MAG TPA: 50S ribosomal protein L1 [Cyclobacteriaceae bacterium]|jgi:large subunit ribosomal protein L1|nr:50S ribosomal protein L1 [Cyclobacteriaceae bacterium]